MFVLRFDLRIPPFVSNLTHAEQYREFLRMVEWSDDKGFAAVVLSEHHGTEDGYMNSPLLLAGSVLGRTSSVFCSVSALLLPLHDPLRIAEEIATIDLIAPGRFNVVIGVGYRESELIRSSATSGLSCRAARCRGLSRWWLRLAPWSRRNRTAERLFSSIITWRGDVSQYRRSRLAPRLTSNRAHSSALC